MNLPGKDVFSMTCPVTSTTNELKRQKIPWIDTRLQKRRRQRTSSIVHPLLSPFLTTEKTNRKMKGPCHLRISNDVICRAMSSAQKKLANLISCHFQSQIFHFFSKKETLNPIIIFHCTGLEELWLWRVCFLYYDSEIVLSCFPCKN